MKLSGRNSILQARIAAANAKALRDAEDAEERAEAALDAKEERESQKEEIRLKPCPELMTVEVAREKLSQALLQAIQLKQDTLFLSSTGIGKTDAFLMECVKANPQFKILVVMQTHALIEQSFHKFKKLQSQTSKVHWFGRAEAKIIKGKKLTCENPTQKQRMELNENHKITKEDCETCYVGWCNYQMQFRDFNENIRFMTVHELYNETSFFDQSEWVPDLILIDDHTFSVENYSLDKGKFTAGIREYWNSPKSELDALQEFQHWLTADLKKAKADRKETPTDTIDSQIAIIEGLLGADKGLNRTTAGFELCRIQRMHSKFKHSTKIWFDGTANAELFKEIYPDVAVQEFHVQKQENAKVYQVSNISWSKHKLNAPENRGITLKWTAAECVKLQAKTPGAITYKNLSEVPDFAQTFGRQLQEELGVSVQVAHLGNTRGYNHFEDCDVGFVLGRYMLPPEVLVGLHRAIYGGECSTETERVYEAVRFRDEKGLRCEPMWTVRYKDSNAQRIHEHFAVAETLQAIGRFRMIHGNEHKHIFLLSNQYMGPNFEVNEFRIMQTYRQIERDTKTDEHKQKIAESQSEKARNAFQEMLAKLRTMETLPDTKAAFLELGLPVRVAHTKALRHEAATAAGFELVEVQDTRSRGRKTITATWTLPVNLRHS